MPGFGNEFNTDKPIGSDLANTLDTIIEAKVKKALNERYSLEHVPLNSGLTGANDKSSANAQGRHTPGAVGVLLTGTTSEIDTFASDLVAAGTPPGTGSLAYDTDTGTIKYFDGASFTTIGLTAVVYTAGDGLNLTAQQFSVDYADDADMSAGTSTTKIPAVADLSLAYGLTPYLYSEYKYNASSSELSTGWNDVPLAAPTINTISGASIVTDTIILDPGIYEIEIEVGYFSRIASNTNRHSCLARLYNDTDAVVVAYSQSQTVEATGSSDSTGQAGPVRLIVQVSPSIQTTYSVDFYTTDNGTARDTYFFDDSQVPSEALTAGVPTHRLRIWKKKLN